MEFINTSHRTHCPWPFVKHFAFKLFSIGRARCTSSFCAWGFCRWLSSTTCTDNNPHRPTSQIVYSLCPEMRSVYDPTILYAHTRLPIPKSDSVNGSARCTCSSPPPPQPQDNIVSHVSRTSSHTIHMFHEYNCAIALNGGPCDSVHHSPIPSIIIHSIRNSDSRSNLLVLLFCIRRGCECDRGDCLPLCARAQFTISRLNRRTRVCRTASSFRFHVSRHRAGDSSLPIEKSTRREMNGNIRNLISRFAL